MGHFCEAWCASPSCAAIPESSPAFLMPIELILDNGDLDIWAHVPWTLPTWVFLLEKQLSDPPPWPSSPSAIGTAMTSFQIVLAGVLSSSGLCRNAASQ